MPEPDDLRLWVSDAMVSITRGSRLLFHFAEDDLGMRNLAILSLRDAGVAGIEVASLFGLTAQRVSDLRMAGKRNGSGGPPGRTNTAGRSHRCSSPPPSRGLVSPDATERADRS